MKILLLLAGIALGITDVYFSVGTSVADFKVAGNISISSGLATFSIAQTGNIGVGDIIVYNTSDSCFIQSKNSADKTQWYVTTKTGATPGDISNSAVVSISRAFNTLIAAINGATPGAAALLGSADLVASDIRLYISIYKDGDITGNVIVDSSWTTDITRYITIYAPYDINTAVNLRQRHTGRSGTGTYWLQDYSEHLRLNGCDYVTVDGLEMDGNNASEKCIEVKPGYLAVTIKNNILHDARYLREIDLSFTTNSKIYLYNNVLYNRTNRSGGDNSGILYFSGVFNSTGPDVYVYNNTIIQSSSDSYCIYVNSLSGDSVWQTGLFYNNILINLDSSSTGTAKCISWKGSDYKPAYITGDGVSTGYNFTSDNILFQGTAGSGSAKNISIELFKFIDIDIGLENLNISKSSICSDAGIDLSSDPISPFGLDIIDQKINYWSVGAFSSPKIGRRHGFGGLSPSGLWRKLRRWER